MRTDDKQSRTLADIASTRTENGAVWNRGACGVLDQVHQLEQRLPSPILSFDSDNGAEFHNHHLWHYFWNRAQPVVFVRCHPYHKNDRARVEQKNWTRLRQLLGYERFGDPTLVAFAPASSRNTRSRKRRINAYWQAHLITDSGLRREPTPPSAPSPLGNLLT